MPFGIGSIGEIVGTVRIDGIEKAVASLQGLSSTISKTGLESKVFNAAMAAAAANLGAALYAAGKFEQQMAKVASTMRYSADEIDDLKGKVLELSKNTHQSLGELTEGLREIAIYGVPASDAIKVLGLASSMAEAGFTNTKVAVDAGMKSITAYGLSISSLGTVYDMQTAAVNAGVGSYEALAGAMGGILPIAKGIGVPLQEIYAAMASMSKVTGVDTATMALKRLFSSMSDNVDIWKQFAGISIFTDQGQFRGVVTIMSELGEKLKTMNPEQVRQLFANLKIDARTLNGVYALTSNIDGLKESLDRVEHSTGLMKAAEESMNNTFEGQVHILKNRLITAYTELGQSYIPILKGITGFMTQSPELFGEIVKNVANITMLIGGLAAAMKVAQGVSAIWATGLGPFGLILGGIAIAILGVTSAIQAHRQAMLREISETAENVSRVKELESKYSILTETKHRTKAQDEELGRITDELSTLYMKLGVNIQDIDKKFGHLGDEIDKRKLKDLQTQAADLEKKMASLGKIIDANKNSVSNAGKGIYVMGDEMGNLGLITTSCSSEQAKLQKELNLVNDEIAQMNGVMPVSAKAIKSVATETDGLAGAQEKLILPSEVLKEYYKILPGVIADANEAFKKHKDSLDELAEKGYGELIDKIDIGEKKIKESNTSWTEYSQVIHAITGKMGTFGSVIGLVADAWGSAFAKTGETSMSLKSVFNWMDWGTGITSLLSIGMDLLGANEKKVMLTTDQVRESMGALGVEMDRVKDMVDSLASSFESDILTALVKQNDLILQLKTNYENAMPFMKNWWLAQLQIKTGFTDFNVAIAETTAEIARLTVAFAFSSAFDKTSNSIKYLTDEAIRLKDTFGYTTMGMEFDGFNDLLKESIVNNENLMAKMDPLSKGYLILAEEIYKAKDALLVMNGAMTVSEFNTKWLAEETDNFGDQTEKVAEVVKDWTQIIESNVSASEIWTAVQEGFNEMGIKTNAQIETQIDKWETLIPYIEKGTAQWKFAMDAMNGLYESVGRTNPYLSEQELYLHKLSLAGIETKDSVYAQIDALLALAPKIQRGSYEWEQYISKLDGLYDKIGEINPLLTEGERFTRSLSKAGIESTASVQAQIKALESLLPSLKYLPYEYAQVTAKLGPLYEKLGMTNKTLEVQIADLLGLKEGWTDFTKVIDDKFMLFNTDAEKVYEAMRNIQYFKLDINTEGWQEKLGAAIYQLQTYVDTLNPKSAAWQAANENLQGVIGQFIQLGGDVSKIKPSIDIKPIVDGSKTASDAVEDIAQTATDTPASPTLDTEAWFSKINWMYVMYDMMVDGMNAIVITPYVDVSPAIESLNQLRNAIDSTPLVSHGGGLLRHAGGPLFDEGAQLLRAHEGLNLGTGGREEVPFIGLKGEYVMRNAFVEKFGVEAMDLANKTLDAGAFASQQKQAEKPIVFSPVINVEKAGPETYVQITDKYIHPRIKKNDLYTYRAKS